MAEAKKPAVKVVEQITYPLANSKPFKYKGLTATVEPDVFNDAKLFNLYRKVVGGDSLASYDLYEQLLGKKQFDDVMKGLENKSGRVPIDVFNDFFGKLMDHISPN